VAGLLHDIGKVRIPLEVINKPGKLTVEEWEQVKRHPVEGALILSDLPGVTRLAMVAAFEHHQHGEVRGYPEVDDQPQQHLFSQIVALCDAYDAITSARVYYSLQKPLDQAVRILLDKRGSAFDPILVKAFVNMVGIFPVGALLKLDTGEIGMVVHQTRDLLRPRLLLLDKFDGSEKIRGPKSAFSRPWVVAISGLSPALSTLYRQNRYKEISYQHSRPVVCHAGPKSNEENISPNKISYEIISPVVSGLLTTNKKRKGLPQDHFEKAVSRFRLQRLRTTVP
jgi:hypothetical protein